MDEVCEEAECNVSPKKNQVWITKQLLQMLEKWMKPKYGTVPEVLSEGASCAPDAMDVDASANSSENFDTLY